ncbi:MAG TPA: SMI1/KNR4 family protein [Pirellulales bacterium]
MSSPALDRLKALALAVPRPGCEWEDRPRFAPPASEEAIASLGREAGFSLPQDFAAFLREHSAVVAMSIHNGYWLGGLSASSRETSMRSVFGRPAIVAATDGGGNPFLLTADGRIWRCDRETRAMREVASSFTAFLDRVADDWEAYATDAPEWQYLV